MNNPFMKAILEGKKIKEEDHAWRRELLESGWLDEVTSFFCQRIRQKSSESERSCKTKIYWDELLVLLAMPMRTIAHYQIAAKLVHDHIMLVNGEEKKIRFDWSSFKPGITNEQSFIRIEWDSNVV